MRGAPFFFVGLPSHRSGLGPANYDGKDLPLKQENLDLVLGTSLLAIQSNAVIESRSRFVDIVERLQLDDVKVVTHPGNALVKPLIQSIMILPS